MPGNGRRCLTGCNKRAACPITKCTVCSTAALAWPWWLIRHPCRRSCPPCKRLAKRYSRLAVSCHTRTLPLRASSCADSLPRWGAQKSCHGIHDGAGGVFCLAIHNVAVWHAAQPRELALGQLTGGCHSPVNSLVTRDLSIQKHPQLTISDAADGRQASMQIRTLVQCLDLCFQTRFQHGMKSLGNAVVQPGAVGGLEAEHVKVQSMCWFGRLLRQPA